MNHIIYYFSKTSAIGPSSRYRIYQFLPLLEAKKINIHISPLFGDFYFKIIQIKNKPLKIFIKTIYSIYSFTKRFLHLLKIDKSTSVVIEHQLFPYLPAFIEIPFIKRAKYVFLEFDDAIYLTFLHRKKFEKLLPLYNGVIAGNKNLAEFAQRRNKNVLIHPTLIDDERVVVKRDYRIKDKVVIGWIGLSWNFKYLTIIQEALRELSKRYEIVLRIVSSEKLCLDGVITEFVQWDYEKEWEEISFFDIGIMPLKDDEWCRGKCGLKLLQYMIAAIPSVSSPVGINNDIVDDGINGYLASNESEWIEKIEKLILSEDLREKIGKAARVKALENFSIQKRGNEIVSFYEKIAKSQI
ncbi:MAG: glycosyltransferase [Candidatus Schekmanbacteria bacterium]|nr:MAG: glycosyltransferase [Candidatus Schekmanbacteria bacterium]